MAQKAQVWAVCNDPGGTNGILPVVQALKERGVAVQLITNGHASKVCHEDAWQIENASELMSVHTGPRVLLTDMSSGGGVGRDLAYYLRGKTTVFALQDFWGGEMTGAWASTRFRPDYLCVNDHVGADVACAAWPDFNRERVLVTGYPALDKYASVDVDAMHDHVRNSLGLCSGLPLVVFMGQADGTAHAVGEVVSVLGELGTDCYFMPRPHPRTKDNFAQEMTPWQKALGKYKGRLVVDWFGQCTPAALVAACAKRRGVVVSMYSTALAEAACVRAPSIAVLYEGQGMRAYMEAVPHIGEALRVSLGHAAIADNRDKLKEHLQAALSAQLALEQAQASSFASDGRNADRVAEAVCKHL